MGPEGPFGPKGEKGMFGLIGLMGEKGYRGDIGFKGHIGSPGIPGHLGLQGPDGFMGLPGCNGTNGCDGDPGMPGMIGFRGPPGRVGDQGIEGDTGDGGVNSPGFKGKLLCHIKGAAGRCRTVPDGAQRCPKVPKGRLKEIKSHLALMITPIFDRKLCSKVMKEALLLLFVMIDYHLFDNKSLPKLEFSNGRLWRIILNAPSTCIPKSALSCSS